MSSRLKPNTRKREKVRQSGGIGGLGSKHEETQVKISKQIISNFFEELYDALKKQELTEGYNELINKGPNITSNDLLPFLGENDNQRPEGIMEHYNALRKKELTEGYNELINKGSDISSDDLLPYMGDNRNQRPEGIMAHYNALRKKELTKGYNQLIIQKGSDISSDDLLPYIGDNPNQRPQGIMKHYNALKKQELTEGYKRVCDKKGPNVRSEDLLPYMSTNDNQQPEGIMKHYNTLRKKEKNQQMISNFVGFGNEKGNRRVHQPGFSIKRARRQIIEELNKGKPINLKFAKSLMRKNTNPKYHTYEAKLLRCIDPKLGIQKVFERVIIKPDNALVVLKNSENAYKGENLLDKDRKYSGNNDDETYLSFGEPKAYYLHTKGENISVLSIRHYDKKSEPYEEMFQKLLKGDKEAIAFWRNIVKEEQDKRKNQKIDPNKTNSN